jgi:hypothetical protein
MPRESADRCALRAEVRDDPMLGTAFPAGRLLLVEQSGAWGRAGLSESAFDRATAAALGRRANAAGVRIQAIRRPGRTPAGGERRSWALVDARSGRHAMSWGTFTEDAELLDLPLDGALTAVGTPEDQPSYLVCTHGKHDPCCALRGRPVAMALEAQRPGRVWETSHLGGDRFAANVLLLPAGLLYGRVRADTAAVFADAADAGTVLADQLRGQIGLAPAAQAALAFAYQRLDGNLHDALRVDSATALLDGSALVAISTAQGQLNVRVRVEQVAASGLTCANPQPNRYLAYHPELA